VEAGAGSIAVIIAVIIAIADGRLCELSTNGHPKRRIELDYQREKLIRRILNKLRGEVLECTGLDWLG
jgi:hypothetical protein